MDSVLEGVENVDYVRLDHHIMPNESRKIIAELSTTEYTCMLENDSAPTPGWLTTLIDACERLGAGVAVPLLLEQGRYHGDEQLGYFEPSPLGDGERLQYRQLGGRHEDQTAQLIEATECHCQLFRTDVIKQHDLFDPELTTHDYLDIALGLRNAGVTIAFEPRARVLFESPPPVNADERAFFRRRWDVDHARISTERVRDRWGYTEITSAQSFSRDRLHRESWLQVGLYTLQVRVWRRIRSTYRRLIGWTLNDRLEWASRLYAARQGRQPQPQPRAAALQAAPEDATTPPRS